MSSSWIVSMIVVTLASWYVTRVTCDVTSSTLNMTLVYPSDATVVLGALFPLHGGTKDASGEDICTHDLQVKYGLQPLEAMLFTLDQINDDPNILPGITLGALALDSCDSPSVALKQSVGFIKGYLASQNKYHQPEFTCNDGSVPIYRGGHFDRVVGVIGGQRSSVSVQMANVLRVIEVPQVSYQSTSSSLSNKMRYPFFLRTVPSDKTQAEAILHILKKFNLTFASIVYSSGEYGERGYQELQKQSATDEVCFASPSLKLSKDDSDDAYQRAVNTLVKTNATAVVVFANRVVMERLMKTVSLAAKHSHFLWIGSDGWSSSDMMGLQATVEGAITVQPLVREIPYFDDYFRKLTPSLNDRNPWFREYWQENLGCPIDDDECGATKLSGSDYSQTPWLHFVRDAVYAFAYALHGLWEAKCEGIRGLCQAMAHDGHIHGQDLYGSLLNVSFPDVEGNNFSFVEGSSGIPRYSILNYQKDDFKYSWVPIGTYSRALGDEPEVFINTSAIRYRDHSLHLPKSSCGKPCSFGQAKTVLPDTCCWSCQDCKDNQYLNETVQKCEDCDECMRPNGQKNGCVKKKEKFIDYKNRWAITSMAFASLGIFSTVLVAAIFWIYLDTPVIKAASRELSYILLGGIFLSFSMTFVIVAPPSTLSCGVTRFFLGFSYTLCYAAILTKTNRISRIFNKKPTKSQKARYTSPQSQIVIVGLLVSVEVVINIMWLTYDTPGITHLCPSEILFSIKICDGLDDYSYIVGLIYPLILVLFCTVYAIKTRKCPGGFNEARHIAFTNYTTCLIWLVFVPLYFSTVATDDIKIITLAMSLSLGGFVQLGCLFFPKVHIVLFKPEKNTRDAVMSINRSSSYRGGSGRQHQETHHSAPAMIYLNAALSPGSKESGLKVPPEAYYQDPRVQNGGDPNNGKVNEGYLTVLPGRLQESTTR